MRRKRQNMRMSADNITLLHFGVVEHSLCGVDWVTVTNIAKITSFVVVGALWLHDTVHMSGCVGVARLSHMRVLRALA